MPDDRPVSPEERLRVVAAKAANDMRWAARKLREDGDTPIVAKLLDSYVDQVDRALSTPAGPSPDQDLTADRSSGGAGDQTGPESACATSPRPDSTTAPPPAPSPREEAVEAAAKALAHEFAYEWVFEDDPQPSSRDADYWRHTARKMIDAYEPAARPPSPTPEDVWKDEAAFPHLSGYAARSATPGDDATTKEGR